MHMYESQTETAGHCSARRRRHTDGSTADEPARGARRPSTSLADSGRSPGGGTPSPSINMQRPSPLRNARGRPRPGRGDKTSVSLTVHRSKSSRNWRPLLLNVRVFVCAAVSSLSSLTPIRSSQSPQASPTTQTARGVGLYRSSAGGGRVLNSFCVCAAREELDGERSQASSAPPLRRY